MNQISKNVNRTYSFSDYDPNWSIQFESLKKFLLEIFKHKALSIEHVGSTSIPGMKAKPILDVLVVVKDIKDLSKEVSLMVNYGYEWGENHIAPDTIIFFKTGPNGEKLDNIHICLEGIPKIKQFLIMRDFFRTFPEKVKAYSDLKESNFKKYPDDYISYRNAKKSFLDEIEKEAYEWSNDK